MLEKTIQQKQKSPRPESPELYRILSKLIENPQEFFDSLIQMETKEGNLTVRAWHLPDPVISLRDIPNPISQAGTDRFPATPEEDKLVCPMELCVTPFNPGEINYEEINYRDFNPGEINYKEINYGDFNPWEVNPGEINPVEINPVEVKTREVLAEHFEAALIHRTQEILQTQGLLDHDLSQQWEEPPRTKDLLTAVKCVFYGSDISESLEDYIGNLNRHLRKEMEKKLNPQVIDLLAQSAPSRGFKTSRKETHPDRKLYAMDPFMGQIGTTIGQYNKAVLVLSCSKETRSANAGAIPFILGQEMSHQEVSHQGEFIGRERKQAMQHGMTAHAWKRMTHMDPKFTQQIISSCNDLDQATGIINWLANQHEKINSMWVAKSSLSQMMENADIREQLSHPPRNLSDLNMGIVAALTIANKDAYLQNYQQEERRRQFVDAVTYAQRMTLEEKKITATTWGGILKAIHQWHERMNRQETKQQWTNIVNANGGKIRSWEPTLGEFKHQDVTATELTDESMLLHEALKMNHCVHLYGNRAQQGTLRIFSLTQESGNRATVSVILRNGLWQQEQVRGKRNHPTTDAMHECTLALVEACNQE